MKKLTVALLTLVILFSGCNLLKKAPQKAVDDGFINMNKVKKSQSSFSMKGVVQSFSGEKMAPLQFTLQVHSQNDFSDEKESKFNITFKLSETLGTSTSSGEIMIKSINKKLYFNVSSLELPGPTGADLKKQLESLFNTWLMVSSEDESYFSQLIETLKIKKIFEEFKASKFFTSAIEDGEDNVQGIKVMSYRVDLDKEVMKNFIMYIQKVYWNIAEPEEEQVIKESLNDVSFSGAVLVGDGDEAVHRIRGTFTTRPLQGASGSYDIDYTSWDYGKDVAIEIPKDAKEFNMMMLLPLVNIIKGTQEVGSSTVPTLPSAVKKVPAKTSK